MAKAKHDLTIGKLDATEQGLAAYSATCLAYSLGFDLLKFVSKTDYNNVKSFFYAVNHKKSGKSYNLSTSFVHLNPTELDEIFTQVGNERAKQTGLKLSARGIETLDVIKNDSNFAALSAMIFEMALTKPGFLSDVKAGYEVDPSVLMYAFKNMLQHNNEPSNHFINTIKKSDFAYLFDTVESENG
jgi:hypothetical protein